VEETVLMARYARLGPLAPARTEDRAAVRHALERCDAWSLRERRTDTLSGGEWQRVRVARALAQEPEALLLDEPTVALDVRHEMEVFELVRALTDGGLGALVITHHLNLAARYADSLLLLDAGQAGARTPGRSARAALSSVFQWPVAVTPWRDGSPQLVPLRPGKAGR
jgi:iron complex transport system ATP-binding protein